MVRARRAAGLGPDVVFHTLRHSYASHLVMAGASLLAVMKLLGHADIRLVVKCYAHLSPDFLADTVRLHFPKVQRAARSRPGMARGGDGAGLADEQAGWPRRKESGAAQSGSRGREKMEGAEKGASRLKLPIPCWQDLSGHPWDADKRRSPPLCTCWLCLQTSSGDAPKARGITARVRGRRLLPGNCRRR